MIKSKRALATLLLTLGTLIAGLTVAAGPAQAAYSPQVILSRHAVPRGHSVAVQLVHFPKNHHGSIRSYGPYWTRYADHHKHHGKWGHYVYKLRVLKQFRTNSNGYKLLAFKIPSTIKKGLRTFTVKVGVVHRNFKIRVV